MADQGDLEGAVGLRHLGHFGMRLQELHRLRGFTGHLHPHTKSVANSFILLPSGSVGERPMVIHAWNFGMQAPLSVVVTPDNSPTVTVPAVINNTP